MACDYLENSTSVMSREPHFFQTALMIEVSFTFLTCTYLTTKLWYDPVVRSP